MPNLYEALKAAIDTSSVTDELIASINANPRLFVRHAFRANPKIKSQPSFLADPVIYKLSMVYLDVEDRKHAEDPRRPPPTYPQLTALLNEVDRRVNKPVKRALVFATGRPTLPGLSSPAAPR